MHTQHRSARKLERIAETFTRLAESFVRGSMNRKSLEGKSPEVPATPFIRPLSRSSELTSQLTSGVISQTSNQFRIFSPSNNTQSASTHNHDVEMGVRNLSGNLADPTLLSFLSYPMDIPMLGNGHSEDTSVREINSFTEQATAVADPLLHQLDLLSTEQSLDGNFDWFSWDTYAWSVGGNGI
ncbi:hypothetical protein OCU04_011726 [Sclerotinia nivalis]|uniref:Uncharacterized protein n=1 Tax=Sclerotinia nivalis TaxID=352851 RepID=A0A9X0A9H4_9HELO|nr:hypothetical protein OCU04_011726 [Sclerotinia nivalis]